MALTRRAFIIGGAVTATACCAGGAGLAWLWNGTAIDTRGEVDFTNRLAVPPIGKSTIDSDGRRVFQLTAAAGEHDFGRGPVPTWGFNGDYLGPTLRAVRGEKVAIRVSNSLPEPTTVHWHGMHLPAAMDGGPHQRIGPGETWMPEWTIDQPAATLWYHPHPHRNTARHVYRGLAGVFIVDDEAVGQTALPHAYGVDDVPVIIQDKAFRAGTLDEGRSMLSGQGILGNTIVINGTLAPHLDVTTERVRLRLLNASNARVFDVGFADGRSFALIGTDGGLMPAPVRMRRVMLSPGERAEIVVTVRAGERLVLRSDPPRLGSGIFGRFFGGADAFDLLELRCAASLTPSPPVPDRLADVARADPAQAVRRRSLSLGGMAINGRAMDMSRIDATVGSGTTEIWQLTNSDGNPHNLHVHGVRFNVITVNGAAPPAHLAGWKDTVYVPPGGGCELAIQFPEFSDPDVPYMFHCHVLFHEDSGMMGQFVVVEDPKTAG